MSSWIGVPVIIVSGSVGTLSNGGASVAASAGGVLTITLPLNQAATYLVTDGTTTYDSLSTQTGATATAVRTFTPPPVSVAGAAGITYSNLSLATGTLTLTGAGGPVAALHGMGLNLAAPAIFSASANVTLASTLSIAGAPTISGGATLTTALALEVVAGASSFGGAVTIVSGGLTITAGGLLISAGTATLQNVAMANGANFSFGTTTGTKFGGATTQKIGFFNATPIVQPVASTNTNTPTAGSTTNVFTNTTFDGGLGGSAFTVGGIVASLKNLGLLAA